MDNLNSGERQRSKKQLCRCGAVMSVAFSVVATACGGGSDTQPTTSTVFVESSGALCAKRDANNICVEPTSSAATTSQLTALQQNSTGDRVRFNALGVQADNYQAFGSAITGVGVTQSQSSYAMLEQPLTLGQNRVTEGAAVYAYDSAPNSVTQRYRVGDNTLNVGLTWNGTPFVVQRSNIYNKTTNTGDGSGQLGIRDWVAFIGPLTDRVDAPADADVKYVGVVDVRAGDGSPIVTKGAPGVAGHLTWGSCPITLTLHTSDGRLTTADAACTDAMTQATIKFSLTPLSFKDSRVWGQVGSEASIRIDGPSIGIYTADRTTAQFSSSTISGAVYGKAAAGIVVTGVGPMGRFFIVAQRQ